MWTLVQQVSRTTPADGDHRELVQETPAALCGSLICLEPRDGWIITVWSHLHVVARLLKNKQNKHI